MTGFGCARTVRERGDSIVPRFVAVTVTLALLLSMPALSLAIDTSERSSTVEAYAEVERVLESDATGITRPTDVAWDSRSNELVITDAARPGRALAMSLTGAARGQVTSAAARALGAASAAAANRLDLGSISADPETVAVAPGGNIFAYAPASATLWELDPSGTPIAQRDLSAAGLTDVSAVAIAPSADTTDLPTEQAAYVADAGMADGTGAGIYEIALVAPTLDAPAIAAAISSVTLVDTINTGAGSAWNPDSPDPSGLAYIPAGAAGVPAARQDRLVSADGEVEETTGAGFNNVNVWFAPRNGSVQTSTMNTLASSTSPTNNEPVGAAYDAARQELYLCKDGSSGRIWVYSMTTGAQLRTFTVTGSPYNNSDCEGMAFNSANNTLYMVDAIDNDLVKVTSSGVIGTAAATVSNYDLTQYGQSEPEGLDVDPATGNIWIVSNKVSGGGTPDPMIEVTPTGALVSSVSIAAADPNSADGLAMAPASAGGGLNIYVADRGVDNNTNSNENDGKIYEFSTGGGGGGSAPVANFSFAQSAGSFTVNFTDTSTNSPTGWAWDFGDTSTTSDTSSLQNPSYTYPAAGTYQVSLTASNTFGSDPVTKSVTVSEDPPPPSGNLLTNGGFEVANGSNQPTSWTLNSGFTRSNAIPAQEGSFVGRHFSTANNGWNVYQQVSVTAGETYSFSGLVNIPTTADKFKFQVKVQWRGSTNTVVVLRKFTDDTAAAWQAVTAGSLVAPAGATSARIQMVPASLNGTVYVDDFVFGVAP